MTTFKQFRWFWAWDDEKEENWLRELAQKGWHFKSVSLPGNYIFEQGEPRDDVYRLDYFTEPKDKVEYLQIFQDAGWDYMGEMNSWQYFRMEAVNGEAPEIYSDNESKSKKYQRLIFILITTLPIFLINVIMLDERLGTIGVTFKFIMFLFLVFSGYAITRLGLRINQLRKKI